jgi:hypothetical protein
MTLIEDAVNVTALLVVLAFAAEQVAALLTVAGSVLVGIAILIPIAVASFGIAWKMVTEDSGSPHGVRSWDEKGRTTYWCPLCGLNAENSSYATPSTCSECKYHDGRDTDWDIPDCVDNKEDYGRIREAYVRDDLGELEFEKQVERVVEFEGDNR